MKGNLIRIIAPHFVAGIEAYTQLGRYDYDTPPVEIHRCAPILHYMRRWTVGRIMRYCRLKGWRYEVYRKGCLTCNGPGSKRSAMEE